MIALLTLALLGQVQGEGSAQGTNTGDVTLQSFGSSPNANAASLAGQKLTLQPASGTQPGGVSTSAQTLGSGDKTLPADAGVNNNFKVGGKLQVIGSSSLDNGQASTDGSGNMTAQDAGFQAVTMFGVTTFPIGFIDTKGNLVSFQDAGFGNNVGIVGVLTQTGNFMPAVTNTPNIGSSSFQFHDIHMGHRIFLDGVLQGDNNSSFTLGTTVSNSALNHGQITLNGGTPATGTASVISGCTPSCVDNDTAAGNATLKCAVSGTTLTATGGAASTDKINWLCF